MAFDREKAKEQLLKQTASALKKRFSGTNAAVYLVGSITRPYCFNKLSDIDIVLRDFHGNRFAIWPELESELGRAVEIILFEDCHFKEHIESEAITVYIEELSNPNRLIDDSKNRKRGVIDKYPDHFAGYPPNSNPHCEFYNSMTKKCARIFAGSIES